MREPNIPASDEFEPVGDADVDEFIDAMERVTSQRVQPRERDRAGWQRVDDLRESRWLREQLDDWEDWERESL